MTPTETTHEQSKKLTLVQKELVSISHFCTSPPKFIRQVHDSDDRIILTRHGHPVAGLVPLWMLTVVEDYRKGSLLEPNCIFAPGNCK